MLTILVTDESGREKNGICSWNLVVYTFVEVSHTQQIRSFPSLKFFTFNGIAT